MPKNLKLDKGTLIDNSTGEAFKVKDSISGKIVKGIASRDLDVGDNFEELSEDGKKVRKMKTISKTQQDDGSISVCSTEVIA